MLHCRILLLQIRLDENGSFLMTVELISNKLYIKHW